MASKGIRHTSCKIEQEPKQFEVMKRNLILLNVLALFSLALIAPNSKHDQIVEKLNAYVTDFPQEKLYLHLDKPYYSTNEDLWFKAYLVDAFNPTLLPVSEVVEVELINEQLEVVERRKIKLENQGGAGHIYLPDDLAPGKYALRAYTNWSRNFDDSFLFTKTFDVLSNYDKTTEEKSDDAISKIDVAFFPEGGELINGIPSIIGFKALNSQGLGVDVEGQIYDQDGNVVTAVKSINKGMGRFIITPQANQSYVAKLNFQGQSQTFDLPKAQASGYSIKATHSFASDKVILGVYAKGESLENGLLLGHQNGREFLRVVTGSRGLSASVNKADFPDGICQLTFFDAEGRPRSERIITVNLPDTSDKININGFKTYGKRDKVSLTLAREPDQDYRVFYQNLSISITPRDQFLIHPLQQNIKNFLLLSADLKGHIEDPEYYLNGSKEAYDLLESLMLTQGWRRFNWEEILFDQEQVYEFLPERNLTIQGQLSNKANGNNPVKGKVMLSVMNEEFVYLESETDENGEFTFNNVEFYDSTKLMFEGKRVISKSGKEKDNVYVQLRPDRPEPVNDINFTNQAHDTDRIASFLKQQGKINQIDKAFNFDDDIVMLEEVEIEAIDQVAIQKDFREYGMLYGTPNNRIVLDSMNAALTGLSIFDWMQSRIPGLRIYGAFPNQTIVIRTAPLLTGRSVPPLFLLNGAPVDVGIVAAMSPSDVEFVDVLRGPKTTIYGPRAFGGVVAVYTKKGTRAEAKEYIPKNILRVTHPGFSVAKEFYSPSYEVIDYNTAKPDFRSTLYWNPNILMKNDTATVSFYTSDQEGVFDIIVEGITSTGKPVYKRDVMYVE